MNDMQKRLLIVAPIALVIALALSFLPVDRDYLSTRQVEVTWLALLPPLVAIVSVLITRWLVPSLVFGIASAAVIHAWPSPAGMAESLIVNYFWDSVLDSFHLSILGFTASLLGLVSVTTASGGLHGMINLILRLARGRRGVSVATVGMGFAIFFDDYANTAIVGPTVRPLFDRLKLSRAKLAYLIDSTAAPIAGLALISTWIGTEVSYLQSAARDLGLDASGYGLFLSAMGYRFYCVFALFLVVVVAATGRDFGPMLKVERRVRRSADDAGSQSAAESPAIQPRWYNAVVPIGTVLLLIMIQIYYWGSRDPGVDLASLSGWKDVFIRAAAAQDGEALTFAMLYSGVTGAALAILLPALQGVMTVREGLLAWLGGVRHISGALVVIVCAWALSAGCRDLETAHYAVAVLRQGVSVEWVPLAVFVTAGLVAFATGTSYGTMAIIIPTAAQLGYESGGEPVMILAMAAVLDGAIFGDHCSPISDTTVLSSICSGCEHLEHVRTQIPYALLGAVVAALAGYALVGAWGADLWVGMAAGATVILILIHVVGRRA
jgi:Na+/H+ antiporter NhaC